MNILLSHQGVICWGAWLRYGRPHKRVVSASDKTDFWRRVWNVCLPHSLAVITLYSVEYFSIFHLYFSDATGSVWYKREIWGAIKIIGGEIKWSFYVLYREYNLIGVLMGLAVYNSIILDLHFPSICYRKLLTPPVVPQEVSGDNNCQAEAQLLLTLVKFVKLR